MYVQLTTVASVALDLVGLSPPFAEPFADLIPPLQMPPVPSRLPFSAPSMFSPARLRLLASMLTFGFVRSTGFTFTA